MITTMKLRKLLFLLPVVALCACENYGQEISATEAREMLLNIDTQDYFNGEGFVVGQYSEKVEFKGEYRFSRTINCSFKMNINDIYCKFDFTQIGNNERTRKNFEYYQVFDYELNDYVHYVKDNIEHVVKVGVSRLNQNEYYDLESEYYSCVTDYGNPEFALLLSPHLATNIFIRDNYDSDNLSSQNNEQPEGVEISYFSKGEKNLTVQYTLDLNPEITEITDDGEMFNKGKMVFKFENNMITNVELNIKSNFGGVGSHKYSGSYKTNEKVTLPKDWKSYLNS